MTLQMEIPHSHVTLPTPGSREGKSFYMDAAGIYRILAQKTGKLFSLEHNGICAEAENNT